MSALPTPPRRRGFAPTLAAALALLAASVGPLFAGDSNKRQAGDGRGLATFGDRGLTSFGDRFSESFGHRGLTSFSDIPLAPMGGLIPGGVAAPDNSSNGSGRGHFGRRGAGWCDTSAPTAVRESATSIGDSFVDDGDPDGGTPLLMPRVELPVIVLDHRPALAQLASTLDAEILRADAAGDGDLVRSLEADRR
jgi:hypothetical protein